MSAIDEVRAAPGGGELAELAAKVVGDPGAISAAAGAWRAAAGTGERHTGALSAAAAEVDGAWEGAGADAFAGYLGRLTSCGDRLRQALAECAGHLDTAARTLRDAEAAAQEICRQYAAAAQELRATGTQTATAPAQAAAGQPLTEEQLAQALRPMLDESRGALQRLVTDTGTTLSTTAGRSRPRSRPSRTSPPRSRSPTRSRSPPPPAGRSAGPPPGWRAR